MRGIKIGALWVHRGKNDVEYLSGRFGDATIAVYPSQYPSGTGKNRRPDYLVYVQEPPDPNKRRLPKDAVLDEAWRRTQPDTEARYYLSEQLGPDRVRELVAEENAAKEETP